MRLTLIGPSLAILGLLAAPAGAQTVTTLFSFTTSSSAYPEAGLTLDPAGNLYGVTPTGGAFGGGTVFRLSSNGAGGYTHSTVFDFSGANGVSPQAGLILDAAGNLIGTTGSGGANSRGTVFRLADDGAGGYTHTILFNFTNTAATGRAPAAPLIADSAGNLYGTTSLGTAPVVGTVFRLTNGGAGSYTHDLLHSFGVASAGTGRKSGLIADAAGNLYGTTESGGANAVGTVYRLSSNGAGGYTHSVLANLNATTGRSPAAGLIADAAGNLYGTAFSGGANAFGTVFRLSDNGAGGFAITNLHDFDNAGGGNPMAGLIADAVGNLFGTTYTGGANQNGTVFRMSSNGAGGYTYTTLFDFNGTDGIKPYGDLIADDDGNLYGRTLAGGANNQGTVFRIANAGFIVAQETETPEPASLALFGIALAALAAHRRPSRAA